MRIQVDQEPTRRAFFSMESQNSSFRDKNKAAPRLPRHAYGVSALVLSQDEVLDEELHHPLLVEAGVAQVGADLDLEALAGLSAGPR